MIAPSISSSCAVSCKIFATSRFSMWLPGGWISDPILLLSEVESKGGREAGQAGRWLLRQLGFCVDFFGACNIFQHLLAQRFRAGKFLLVAQALQEAHLHLASRQRRRKIEQMRFDRQARAIKRGSYAHIRDRAISAAG